MAKKKSTEELITAKPKPEIEEENDDILDDEEEPVGKVEEDEEEDDDILDEEEEDDDILDEEEEDDDTLEPEEEEEEEEVQPAVTAEDLAGLGTSTVKGAKLGAADETINFLIQMAESLPTHASQFGVQMYAELTPYANLAKSPLDENRFDRAYVE